MQHRYRVKFCEPERTFYVRASNVVEAYDIARSIEIVLEGINRGRSITETVIACLTGKEEW